MGCGHVASGHWAGVAALSTGLALCLLGVAGPWWKIVDGQKDLRLEGLWQVCLSDDLVQCKFSDRHYGLWRSIQVLHIVSLMSLLFGVVCSCISATKRRATSTRCPASSVAALAGGVTGLMADLLYVGYIERHARHVPREHAYAWSFALCVCGAAFSFLAALALCLAPRCCHPRFTPRPVEPYRRYRHYRVAVGPDGCPHLYPYPGPYYPEVRKAWGEPSAAAEKRRECEKSRNGHVWFAPLGPAGDGDGGVAAGAGPGGGEAPPGYVREKDFSQSKRGLGAEATHRHRQQQQHHHHHHHHSANTTATTIDTAGGWIPTSDGSSSSSGLGRTTDDSRSQPPGPRQGPRPHPGQNGQSETAHHYPVLTDSGQASFSDSNSRPHCQPAPRSNPGPAATIPSVQLPNGQPRGMQVKVQDQRVPFTVQQAMEEEARRQRSAWEGGWPLHDQPGLGEGQVWRYIPPSIPPMVYLPQHQPRPQPQGAGGGRKSRGMWLPWGLGAGQERAVVKPRSNKL